MAVLILDPYWEAEAKRAREASGADDRYDETWDGVLVMTPAPNNEHHRLQAFLVRVIATVIDDMARGETSFGVNVSDRAVEWTRNYRCPDVVVYLVGTPAVDHGTFWQGGPDFAVEVVSPGEDPHAKLGFYALVKTRELLVIHRDPWALELFTLDGVSLRLTGQSDEAEPVALPSATTGLTFRVVRGPFRPLVEVTHPATNRTWRG